MLFGLVLAACALRVPGARAQAAPGPTPQAEAPALVLVETQGVGVDPVVGRFVDRALRRSAQALGYRVLAPGEGRRALQQMGAAYPPGMPDLWRCAYRLQAAHAVFAVAWASAGRYVVQVRVASRDGGPAYAQGDADNAGLESRAAALLVQALVPAAAVAPTPAPAPAPAQSAASGLQAGEPEPGTAPVAPGPAAPAARSAPGATQRFFARSAPAPRAPPRFRLALHNDAAFGTGRPAFFNDVVGARVDYGLGEATWLGAHLGYADLAARHGRVHSVLGYAQLEQRIALAGGALQIPLRFDLGYLARNGGFLRLSSGLAVGLGSRLELVLDLLAPAFWLTPEGSLFSLDLGTELAIRL